EYMTVFDNEECIVAEGVALNGSTLSFSPQFTAIFHSNLGSSFNIKVSNLMSDYDLKVALEGNNIYFSNSELLCNEKDKENNSSELVVYTTSALASFELNFVRGVIYDISVNESSSFDFLGKKGVFSDCLENYEAIFEPLIENALPEDLAITSGGEKLTQGVDYSWDMNTGELVIYTSAIIGNIQILCSSNEIYTINYNLDGGTADNPVMYTKDTPTFTLSTPTKYGCEFQGWTGSNGETPQLLVAIEQGSTGDKSYTANWAPGNYTLLSGPGLKTLIQGEGVSSNQSITSIVFDKYSTYANTFPIWENGTPVDIDGVGYIRMFSDDVAKRYILSVGNIHSHPNSSTMFNGYFALTTLVFNNFDTSNVTDMSWMFKGSSPDTLDLSNFDTSNVTDMNEMFSNCSASITFPTNFGSSATDMSSMFYAYKGSSLNLSNFNTSNVTDMSRMFFWCSSLETIYVGNSWSTAKVTSSNGMFDSCTKHVGGNGTKYNSLYDYKTYARIDEPGTPGYFTSK
ncbi:MAG: BspA family leucine-rich repeat surface protein, partial [Clostridia bacterium]|nr:BspA family leucine-rich repeat surface protein [Clostridia bacterium]